MSKLMFDFLNFSCPVLFHFGCSFVVLFPLSCLELFSSFHSSTVFSWNLLRHIFISFLMSLIIFKIVILKPVSCASAILHSSASVIGELLGCNVEISSWLLLIVSVLLFLYVFLCWCLAFGME